MLKDQIEYYQNKKHQRLRIEKYTSKANILKTS